jgi:hypothetical protein
MAGASARRSVREKDIGIGNVWTIHLTPQPVECRHREADR